MDTDTICQKLLLKVVLKEPHPYQTILKGQIVYTFQNSRLILDKSISNFGAGLTFDNIEFTMRPS
jgi:hypothetical protein